MVKPVPLYVQHVTRASFISTVQINIIHTYTYILLYINTVDPVLFIVVSIDDEWKWQTIHRVVRVIVAKTISNNYEIKLYSLYCLWLTTIYFNKWILVINDIRFSDTKKAFSILSWNWYLCSDYSSTYKLSCHM